MLEGQLRFRVGRRRLTAGPGDTVRVPPGTVHHFANRGRVPVRVAVRTSPALTMLELLETAAALAAEQHAAARRLPRPLDLALFMRDFEREVRAPYLPAPLVRAVVRAAARLARRRGLDARYRRLRHGPARDRAGRHRGRAPGQAVPGRARNAVDGISFTVPVASCSACSAPTAPARRPPCRCSPPPSRHLGPGPDRGPGPGPRPGRVRRELGVVFQQPSLDLNLSAEGTSGCTPCCTGCIPGGRPTAPCPPPTAPGPGDGRVLGLTGLLRQRARTLSGGLRRGWRSSARSCTAPGCCSSTSRPRAWTPRAAAPCGPLARARAELGTTVFLTTHYLEEAEAATGCACWPAAGSSSAAPRPSSRRPGGRLPGRGLPAAVRGGPGAWALMTRPAAVVLPAGHGLVRAGRCIAQRDVIKLLRDRPRLAVNLAFPVLLIGGLGAVLQPTVGRVTGLTRSPSRSPGYSPPASSSPRRPA